MTNWAAALNAIRQRNKLIGLLSRLSAPQGSNFVTRKVSTLGVSQKKARSNSLHGSSEAADWCAVLPG
jgi:hypothetical protein